MLLATKLKGVSLKYALTSDMEMQNLEFSHLFSVLLWSTVSSLCSPPLCNGNILVSLFGGICDLLFYFAFTGTYKRAVPVLTSRSTGRMVLASCWGSIVELALDVGVAGELVPRV